MQLYKLIGLFTLIILTSGTTSVFSVDCHREGSVENASCYCKEWIDSETSTSGGGTAPWPRNASITFFKDNGKLLPIISWTVSTQYLHHINGFYVQATILYSLKFKFNCSFNYERVEPLWLRDRITFNFKYCCDDIYDGLHSGDPVHALILSLPLFSSGDNPYYVTVEKTIPDVEPSPTDHFIAKLTDESIIAYTGTTTFQSADERENLRSDDSVLLPVVIGLTIPLSVTSLVAVAIYLARKRKKTEKELPRTSRVKQILVISDDEPKYLKLHNFLIETVKKCCVGEVEVIANVRKRSEIANCPIVEWMTKNIRVSDVVVFVISNPSQLSNITENDSDEGCLAVNVALNIAQAEVAKLNFSKLRNRYVILLIGGSVHQTNILPYFSRYILPDQLKEALKQIFGAQYDSTFRIENATAFIKEELSGIYNTPVKERLSTESGNVSSMNDLDASDRNASLVELNNFEKSILYRTISSVENNDAVG